jgi:hypothetical protein
VLLPNQAPHHSEPFRLEATSDPTTGVTITLTAAQVQLWLTDAPNASFAIVLTG